MTHTPRRIVVTGVGLVTPLGANAPTTFQNVLAGKSGLVPLRRAPYFLPGYLSEDKRLPTAEKRAMLKALEDAMPCRVVGAVRENNEDEYYYDYEDKASAAKRKALRFAPTSHEPRSFRFCAAAVEEALRDALLLHPPSVEKTKQASPASGPTSSLIGISDPRTVGVNIGMGIPSLSDVTDVAAALTGDLKNASCGTGASARAVHYSKINPFFVPKILGNMAAGVTAIKHNCQGFISSSVAACATGAHCIGESLLVLRQSAEACAEMQGTEAAFREFLQQQHQQQDANADASPFSTGHTAPLNVMICGATEACITPVSIGGFARMRALSAKHNAEEPADDGPATASRPFDATRDGFVMAEGAGILILEEYEHAVHRITNYLESITQDDQLDEATKREFANKSVSDFIYGEVAGFGASCDAHHVAAPHPDGRGAEACLRSCLANAAVYKDSTRPHAFYRARTDRSAKGPGTSSSFTPLRIGYVNAHATGTIGDDIEMEALRRVFGAASSGTPATPASTLYVSSTKGSIGHLLGAAGSVEAALALLALRHGTAPPTANLRTPCLSPEEQQREGILLNAEAAALPDCEAVVSTSFGFGGINTALLFTKL